MIYAQTLAALDMDAVIYQVTGMCVVFVCLCFLSVMLTISGAVAQRLDAKRKAQAEAAKAAMAPAPVAAPVAAVAPELAPAQVAAIAAGIYDAAQSSITPQVVAAIAAAVKVTVGNEARILDIKPVDTAYAQGGRAAAMNNSPVR